MNHLVLADEIASFAKQYATFAKQYMHPPKLSSISKRGRFLFKRAFVVTDGSPLGKYMVAAMDTLVKKGLLDALTCLTVGEAEVLFPEYEYGSTDHRTLDDLKSMVPADECAFLFFPDCQTDANREAWLDAIQRVTDFAASCGSKTMSVVAPLLPAYPVIPKGITSLAEREFSYFLERTIEELTPGQAFYVEIERLCRQIVAGGYAHLNVARVDNLFGPGANEIRGFDLEACIRDIFATGTVTITPEDYTHTFTVSYIQGAMQFLLPMLYTGRKGQVYNFCSHTVTVADIKAAIHKGFCEQLSLQATASPVTAMDYRCVNTLKHFQCGWAGKQKASLEDVLYQTVCDITGQPHNNQRNIEIYAGKLPRIKELEMMMLRDIDEICRRHNIRYFLCGGTMLGAVRYGHSIPWDDDLDIGMLREDFEKFRKVCQAEHKDIYTYSSHINKSGSHYIVDKLRLNGTYFSTKYSSIHEYQDGLFIDVLVYDRTTNNRFLGKLHGYALHALSKCIELRWYNKPRKNYHYKKTLVLLPFLRLFPLKFYHWLHESIGKWYVHSRKGRFVVDTTGKLQKKGPFSIEGLEEVQYVDYDEGFKAPIPADPTSYLTFDYGPNYLPEPPLSQRVAPHNFARIDLGEYIFETRPTPEFRDVNVHGELFEQDRA